MIPWPVVIALAVLALALLIKHLFSEIVEEENTFLGIVGIFIVIYVGAAVAMTVLMPRMSANPAPAALSE